MKKWVSPLLWFGVPTLAFTGGQLLLSRWPATGGSAAYGGAPVFVGLVNYFRLFMDDFTFTRALYNTFAIPALIGLLIVLLGGTALYLLRLWWEQKGRCWVAPVFYGCLFALAAGVTLAGLTKITLAAGVPCLEYAAQTITSHINDYDGISAWRLSLKNGLFSAQGGVILCFLFWLAEGARRRISARRQRTRIAGEGVGTDGQSIGDGGEFRER